MKYIVAATLGTSAAWLLTYFWITPGEPPGGEQLLAVAVLCGAVAWVGTRLRAWWRR